MSDNRVVSNELIELSKRVFLLEKGVGDAIDMLGEYIDSLVFRFGDEPDDYEIKKLITSVNKSIAELKQVKDGNAIDAPFDDEAYDIVYKD